MSPVRDHVGEAWYQTTVRVPRGWDGRRVVLYFESATHRATVWVDDVEVVSHEGGYTPFEADVTGYARPGGEARVTVAVDNTLTFQTSRPASSQDTPDGKRQQYWHDFFNYAGIHRPVWLYSTAPAHVTDITVVTGLDGADGTVEYQVEAADADGAEVQVVLRDARRRRGRHRQRRERDAHGCRTCTDGPRATATSTTCRCSWSTARARCWTATTRAWACGPSRCGAPSSSSTASRSSSPGSVCTRTT